MYCGGRSKRQTQWVWRQASERLLFNRNNKIKCPKGMKCPKETGGSGVLVVLRGLWRRGSVLEGRVQVRGGVRQPHALPSEVRGARGGGFSSDVVYLLACGTSRGLNGPASWPVSRVRVRQLLPQRSLPGPTRTPACMHGEETSLQRRGALGI